MLLEANKQHKYTVVNSVIECQISILAVELLNNAGKQGGFM